MMMPGGAAVSWLRRERTSESPRGGGITGDFPSTRAERREPHLDAQLDPHRGRSGSIDLLGALAAAVDEAKSREAQWRRSTRGRPHGHARRHGCAHARLHRERDPQRSSRCTATDIAAHHTDLRPTAQRDVDAALRQRAAHARRHGAQTHAQARRRAFDSSRQPVRADDLTAYATSTDRDREIGTTGESRHRTELAARAHPHREIDRPARARCGPRCGCSGSAPRW
jgi:hypothetical protein